MFLWESHLELAADKNFSWGSASIVMWCGEVMSEELLLVLSFNVGYVPDFVHCFHEILG